ncbi:MAG TPA: type II toxin-antitoxin system death-on-curing family toxin [Candidatus Aquilonibacter sp.]
MKWIREDIILAIHEAPLTEHGGRSGIRDVELLRSALARLLNLRAYEHADIPTLGAAYAIAIIHNHPFIDGNKRVGLVVLRTFLFANGFELRATNVEKATIIRSLAAGSISDRDFTQWVRERTLQRG